MEVTTRKGLPVPESTDVDTGTYNIGSGSRATTTTGKVRDTIRNLSLLLDYITEIDRDEVVTGKWSFSPGIQSDHGLVRTMLNKSGAQRILGDVVILDPATDSGFILPTAANIVAAKVFVVTETIAIDAVGLVAQIGSVVKVRVAAATTRNQFLSTQNGSGVASASASQGIGSFAYTLTDRDVDGYSVARLIGGMSGLDTTPAAGTHTLHDPQTKLVVADAATITFDLALRRKFKTTLGGNRQLALANVQDGHIFSVEIVQDATGSRIPVWWSGIKWAGGTAPTLTTTPDKADEFVFECVGVGVYNGFVVGQNI